VGSWLAPVPVDERSPPLADQPFDASGEDPLAEPLEALVGFLPPGRAARGGGASGAGEEADATAGARGALRELPPARR
jgi:hypothetical protein